MLALLADFVIIFPNGQVLVFHDILGYGVDRVPKFVWQYASLDPIITESIQSYVKDVKEKKFPEESTPSQ